MSREFVSDYNVLEVIKIFVWCTYFVLKFVILILMHLKCSVYDQNKMLDYKTIFELLIKEVIFQESSIYRNRFYITWYELLINIDYFLHIAKVCYRIQFLCEYRMSWSCLQFGNGDKSVPKINVCCNEEKMRHGGNFPKFIRNYTLSRGNACMFKIYPNK